MDTRNGQVSEQTFMEVAAERMLALCSEIEKHAEQGEFMPGVTQVKRFADIISEAYAENKPPISSQLTDMSNDVAVLENEVQTLNDARATLQVNVEREGLPQAILEPDAFCFKLVALLEYTAKQQAAISRLVESIESLLARLRAGTSYGSIKNSRLWTKLQLSINEAKDANE